VLSYYKIKKMKTFYHVLFIITFFFQLNGNAQTVVAKEDNNKPIIIYGSPDCHYCTDLKDSLTKKQMAFVFFDIDRDTKALNQMLIKLRNANISTNNLQIPVVDKYGVLYVNNANFKDFITKITE
ncbi:MAG: glutaredoxin family protein, partial [Flavobacterium sp.]